MAKDVSAERKKCANLQRQDTIKEREMKSAFTHWANLGAVRDDISYCKGFKFKLQSNYETQIRPANC